MHVHASRPSAERATPPPVAARAVPLLALQRSAGNAAVARLVVQRVTYERVDSDPYAERFRSSSDTPTADRDVAVAYTAPAHTTTVTAQQPQWSAADGSGDSAKHAERLVLASARVAGFRHDVPPAATDFARVVSVYTELRPCPPCAEWLEDNARFLRVRWTAPPASSHAEGPRWIAKRLWLSRNDVLAVLARLRRSLAYDFDHQFQGWVDALRQEIVAVTLDPASTAAHLADPNAAVALDKSWRDRAGQLEKIADSLAEDAAHL